MLRFSLILSLCVVIIGTTLGASVRNMHAGRNTAKKDANRGKMDAIRTLMDFLNENDARDTVNVDAKSCPNYCEVCDNPDKCKSCEIGYGMNAEGQCQPCPEKCMSCREGKCLNCDYGFALTDNSCTDPCAENCRECRNAPVNICTQCNDGYYTTDDGRNVGQGCKPCSANCMSCWRPDHCNRCASGYGVDKFDKQPSDIDVCEPCQAHCQSCGLYNAWNNPMESCDSCEYGYELDSNKKHCVLK